METQKYEDVERLVITTIHVELYTNISTYVEISLQRLRVRII